MFFLAGKVPEGILARFTRTVTTGFRGIVSSEFKLCGLWAVL